MIRFSAGLVVVAIGVLIGGVVTSRLSLVYVAIAVSAVALVVLAIGVALKRNELFGSGPKLASADAGAGSGMPVGQSADTADVRGSGEHVRADLAMIRPTVPGPATAAFEAAAAAQASVGDGPAGRLVRGQSSLGQPVGGESAARAMPRLRSDVDEGRRDRGGLADPFAPVPVVAR